MIRDAHDFRAGIHDRQLRKLTGRSYSALVHPIVRDYPIAEMVEGDVFFHNDVYESEGGIGHLPDLCVTVPVFHQGEVVAFVQAFGHHDDIGGAVPGSMPSNATTVYEEGLAVPPIKLWDAGVPNRSALRIMTRNSRMPDSLAADLDAECSACLMGARRLGELFDRYGREAIETSFDAILDTTTETYRREILSKIPDGTYVWEDYAEHDGVDEPQLHTQRITLTKVSDAPADPENGRPAGPRLIIDFTGTSAQAKGPINHCGDYVGGNFLKKWLAPILRNLADTPERMAELDVNEGIVPLIEMRFPEKGTLLTPIHPGPTNARTFVILRLLGVLAGVVAKAVDGKMPADQETIRYTGVYGKDLDGNDYLMREVLGGGSGGRYYADGEDTIHVVPDSRNLPTEFTESRFPFIVERLGLAVDSGGAGEFRGGLGYEKHIRMLKDGALHVHRRPLDPGLLGRARRQGRHAVPGRHRPGRPRRARGRRPRRRRGDQGRPARPDPYDGWRRLGRPAGPRPRARRPRRRLGQGLGRGRAARLRRGARPVRATPATCRSTRPRRPSERGSRAAWSREDDAFFDRGPGYASLADGAASADVDRSTGSDVRVAVVGGHGKTGRAVCAALADREVEAVPLGRADWPDLALGGRRVRGGVRHRAEPAPRRAGVRRLGACARWPRPASGGWSTTRSPRPTSRRCRTTSARRSARTWSGAVRPRLDDPPAGRLPPEPRPHRPARGAVLPRRAVRLPRPRRPRPGRGARADRGRPRRGDVRARHPRRDGPRAGGRGGRRGAAGRRSGHPPLAVRDVRLLRHARAAGGHEGARGAAGSVLSNAGATVRPVLWNDDPGTVLVWRSPDGLVQHAAVTLGDGWALHKPSQGWMSPTKVLTVEECKASSREVGRRLERHRVSEG